VALWYEKYKNVLPRDWREWESGARGAVSLGQEAGSDASRTRHSTSARGARRRTAAQPSKTPKKAPPSRSPVLTAWRYEHSRQEAMFNLELMQRWL